MNPPAIRSEQRQSHALTPRLQHAVRLLQLSSLDFSQEIQQALETNPFLEIEETPADDATDARAAAQAGPESTFDATNAEHDVAEGAHEDAYSHAADADLVGGGEVPEDRITHLDAADAPWEETGWEGNSRGEDHGNPRLHGGLDTDLAELTAATVGLRDHLHRQIGMRRLSARDRWIADLIIEAIDDDGYLRLSDDALGESIGAEWNGDPAPPGPDEVRAMLRLVQALDPCGVAARDLRECLLLQVDERTAQAEAGAACGPEQAELRADARLVIERHLAQVAAREFTSIARSLGLPARRVDRACDYIRHLDPRPGEAFGAQRIDYVIPDVIVRKIKGCWSVALNPAVVPRVRLNHAYASLFRSHRDASHAQLGAELQEARWMIRNVSQRFSTILSVAQAIVARQTRYLEYGDHAMRPLGLKEIADALGLHESTVSRVTNNKYMDTPNGVVELKHFFSRAMPTAQGGGATATAIRGVIKDLLAAERTTVPLSDAKLTKLLARQGLKVARRTVTKYRQMMQVPAVELRRQQAKLL